MTAHDQQVLPQEAPLTQAPTALEPHRQTLVWRQPRLLWCAVIVVFGLALPAFVLYQFIRDFVFFVPLPAACFATFAGILDTPYGDKPQINRGDVMWRFLKWGGWLILGCSLLVGPFFPIAIMVGLIIGTPWALWVGLITGFCAMSRVDVEPASF